MILNLSCEDVLTILCHRNEQGIIGQFKMLDAMLEDTGFDPEIPISTLECVLLSHSAFSRIRANPTLFNSYIDKGTNPDLYIKEMRSSGLQETDQVKSKMLTMVVCRIVVLDLCKRPPWLY